MAEAEAKRARENPDAEADDAAAASGGGGHADADGCLAAWIKGDDENDEDKRGVENPTGVTGSVSGTSAQPYCA